ncbi:MAG: hypothetical protein J6N52_03275 [Clostridia bacterium]|nr:hypothetical protein [Clostridia bacterium]
MKGFKKIISLAVGSALLLSCLPVISHADGSLDVSAVSDVGTAALTWNDVGAAKYVIERGGETIGEVDGDIFTFTDFAPDGDSVADYTVNALDSEGNITESDKTQVFVQDANTVAGQMIFDCGSGSYIKYEGGSPVHYDYDGAVAARDGDWKGMNEGDIALKPGKSIKLSYLEKTNYIDFDFGGNVLDISDIKDNGFFGFLVYTDAENTEDLPYVAFCSPGWKWTNAVDLKNKVIPGKWTFIKINISDVMNSQLDLTKINHIRFTANGSSANHDIYIQGLGFYKSAAVMLNSVTEDKGKVTLSWHCDNSAASYYKVYCNGDEIAETSDTSYEYSIKDDKIFYTYYVEACTDDGKTLSRTSEKQIVAYNADFYEYFMAYKDDTLLNGFGCGDNPNWTDPEYDSNVKAFGKKSLKLKIYDGVTTENKKKTDNIFMPIEKLQDFSELADTGYLQLLIYADAESAADLPSVAFGSKGYKWSNLSSLQNIELNKWNFVKIKISDMISENTTIDMSQISEIRFFMPSTISKEYHIYIQNLGFYNKILPPTATVTACGIDNRGNSYADVMFSRSMKEESLANGFGVDGMNIVSTEYSADTRTARLIFDKQLEFPKEYAITAADSVVCTYDRQLENKEIKFKTGNVQNSIYINSCKVDKSAAASGTLKTTADITGIYCANADEMDIAMYTVVYDGDKLVAISSVDIDNFTLKENKSDLADIINFTAPENAADVKAEVFFVDRTDFGRPLCAKLEF